ncbi:molybdenum cofactor biosynthesis protein C [Sulfobacillus acidophilus TPY]|uniref:Cyclic pyranopterin monophosphate synthase n=1 Tax=Sulfobacillus acidophilus (strain ATCC 700253 / DSM 10332 / NAL) TaxID=679936 RepID=G8TXU0_SULAD|nr:molybdenum cofactor biosynthesis protein C [Sulfobacillus acidophilus TPY]AEW06146.1 GTP cyclohydrolase subunit MoaC [Sulfobacillus acidophilus DSM 10332]
MAPHRDFPHLNDAGEVHMVDVAAKPSTPRRAVAEGRLVTTPEVVNLVRQHAAPKGDVLAVARVAAIQAAKRTAEWIPLAHPVPLTHVAVEISPEPDGFRVLATVETVWATGVEMEALTAVTAALLTLYDMLKARDRGMVMTGVQLVEKTGGRSGTYRRTETPPEPE